MVNSFGVLALGHSLVCYLRTDKLKGEAHRLVLGMVEDLNSGKAAQDQWLLQPYFEFVHFNAPLNKPAFIAL